MKQTMIIMAIFWGIVFALAIAVAWGNPVAAHEWYAGKRNPITGEGCCGGKDCHPIMLDELGRVTEDNNNFIIDGIWKFPKSEAMPAQEIKDGESGYSFCIWGTPQKAKCFFFPSGS